MDRREQDLEVSLRVYAIVVKEDFRERSVERQIRCQLHLQDSVGVLPISTLCNDIHVLR